MKTLNKTKIEWCDYTLNPVVGCKRGCPYCYARNMAKRWSGMRQFAEHKEELKNFTPFFRPQELERVPPKKPCSIFVGSMSDIEFWKDYWGEWTYSYIRRNPQHIFYFLTKSNKNNAENPFNLKKPQNLKIGKTITKNSDIVLSGFDFVSIEPMLEKIDTALLNKFWFLKWIIVGAETGNRKEKITVKNEWLKPIEDYAKTHDIKLFYKDSLKGIASNMYYEIPKWDEKLGV